MTQSDPESDLAEDALDWIVLLKTGAPTRADAEALRLWRLRSHDHEAAFRNAVTLYRRGQAALEPFRVHPPEVHRRLGTSRLVLTGALAAIAGVLAAHLPFGPWPSLSNATSTFEMEKRKSLS